MKVAYVTPLGGKMLFMFGRIDGFQRYRLWSFGVSAMFFILSGAAAGVVLASEVNCEGPFRGQQLTGEILSEVLLAHSKWLSDRSQVEGKQANLCGTDLTKADLREVDLSGASLQGANMTRANLTGAILVKADLRDVNLQDA